jgi:hypothetical protein
MAGVKQFLLDTVMQCRKKGYVETLFGRRRYLATICSSNAAVRGMLTHKIAFHHLFSFIITQYMHNVFKCFKTYQLPLELSMF